MLPFIFQIKLLSIHGGHRKLPKALAPIKFYLTRYNLCINSGKAIEKDKAWIIKRLEAITSVLPEPAFLSERELLNKLDEMVILKLPLLTTRYRLKKAPKAACKRTTAQLLGSSFRTCKMRALN